MNENKAPGITYSNLHKACTCYLHNPLLLLISWRQLLVLTLSLRPCRYVPCPSIIAMLCQDVKRLQKAARTGERSSDSGLTAVGRYTHTWLSGLHSHSVTCCPVQSRGYEKRENLADSSRPEKSIGCLFQKQSRVSEWREMLLNFQSAWIFRDWRLSFTGQQQPSAERDTPSLTSTRRDDLVTISSWPTTEFLPDDEGHVTISKY